MMLNNDNQKEAKSLANYNIEVHRPKGAGRWRMLYAEFMKRLEINSIVEFGSGSPDFLKTVYASRKVAIDGGDRWKNDFKEAGIEFVKIDMDFEDFPDIGKFEVAVCSDVFEHLLYPDKTLKAIKRCLFDDGILFSHVPNEFTFKKTVQIMLGISNSSYFHKHCQEFNDPHLHRFTKIGYEKFLETEFKYNVFIADMRFNKTAMFLRRIGISVPYAFQGGPTFVSSNNEDVIGNVKDIKRMLSAKSK